MEWGGMGWNGMEWYMEWYMEWNGIWNGMEWDGMEWTGMERNGMSLAPRLRAQHEHAREVAAVARDAREQRVDVDLRERLVDNGGGVTVPLISRGEGRL